MVSYFQDTLFFNPPTLTAPGVTTAVQVYENNYFSTDSYCIIVKLANRNTHVNIALEGSINGTDYAPLISQQISQNGVTAYNITGCPVKYIRGNFVSESGGTDAEVTFNLSAR